MKYKNYFSERSDDLLERIEDCANYQQFSAYYSKFFNASNFFEWWKHRKCWRISLKLSAIICITGLSFLVHGDAIAQKPLNKIYIGSSVRSPSIYTIKRLKNGTMKIDGKWNKSQWRSVKAVHLSNYMGQIPSFRPDVRAKMMYDEDNIYLIFRVSDRFVRSVVEEYNGPVSTDACVEFFFSPDVNLPERYFNLEINAGGTPLMAYHIYQQKEYQKFSVDDLKKIEIAHSLPGKVDPEIHTPIVWTIEYKLPFSVLKKYGSVINPKAGEIWKANFYETASKGSNPHYLTWSYVDNSKPSFHLPQFFGELKFGK